MDRAVDITTDRIRAYIADRQGTGAANASIKRELAALKRMFTLAIQAESPLRSNGLTLGPVGYRICPRALPVRVRHARV